MTEKGHERIPAGYVRRAHGIVGDVVVRGMLTDAEHRFGVGAVLVTNEERPREFTIEDVRPHQGDYIISFAEIGNRNEADGLRGLQFTIDKSDRRQLDDGEWWPEDLVGCNVVSIDGVAIGVVKTVITGGPQDRLGVETSDGVMGEVPFVEALVSDVDIVNRKIVVDLPEGLFE